MSAIPHNTRRVPIIEVDVGSWRYIRYAKIFTKTMTEEAYIVYVIPTGKCIITWDIQANEIIAKERVRSIGTNSVKPSVCFTNVFAKDPNTIVPKRYFKTLLS